MYGVDWSGPMPTDDDVESVEVPHITTALSDGHYSELASIVSPLDSSESYGLDLFLATLAYVQQRFFLSMTTICNVIILLS